MKLDDNANVSIFEISGMITGLITQDKHHFYGVSNTGANAINPNGALKDLLGGTIPKLMDGARIAMNKITNNPNLASPSITAMKYFGALPIFKKAMDQIHAKKISVFTNPTSGSGLNAFNFQNMSLFNGEASLQNIIQNVLFGSSGSLITQGHYLEETMINMAKSFGKSMGADEKTMINPATDTLKLMTGLAAGFAGGKDPFSSSIYNDGVTMAKEVTQWINKINNS